ncbi:hypothetical protein D3C84_884790 [compost metagenome]
MAKAVDYPGGPERNPHHLHRPHRQADGTKQDQVDQRHQGHPGNGEARVEVALDPVVRTVLAVNAQGLLLPRFLAVQFGALAQYGSKPLVSRAVWIVSAFALGVVLAVDSGPGPGVHPSCQP